MTANELGAKAKWLEMMWEITMSYYASLKSMTAHPTGPITLPTPIETTHPEHIRAQTPHSTLG